MDVHINIQYILQNKTKKKFVGIIHVYCTCNWIRSDPNTDSLGLGAPFCTAGTERG